MLLFTLLILVGLFGFVAFFGAPYVPSKRRDVKSALSELYPLGPEDLLVDIGSGDGVVLREASRLGARAVGYEINPVLVLISRLLSRNDGNVMVRFASFWGASFPLDTTVVYVFGDSRDIIRMFNKVERTASDLGRPISFISYAFQVPSKELAGQVGPHYLYVVNPLQGREA